MEMYKILSGKHDTAVIPRVNEVSLHRASPGACLKYAGTDAGTVRQCRKTPRLAPGQVCDAGTPGQMLGQILSA